MPVRAGGASDRFLDTHGSKTPRSRSGLVRALPRKYDEPVQRHPAIRPKVLAWCCLVAVILQAAVAWLQGATWDAEGATTDGLGHRRIWGDAFVSAQDIREWAASRPEVPPEWREEIATLPIRSVQTALLSFDPPQSSGDTHPDDVLITSYQFDVIKRSLTAESTRGERVTGTRRAGRTSYSEFIMGVRAGAPFRSFYTIARPQNRRTVWTGGLELDRLLGNPSRAHLFGMDGGVIPLYPLWTGLALNTLVYTAVLYPLVLWHKAGRRKRRRKRGLCERCSYDITGQTTCPECGEPTNRPRPATRSPEPA